MQLNNALPVFMAHSHPLRYRTVDEARAKAKFSQGDMKALRGRGRDYTLVDTDTTGTWIFSANLYRPLYAEVLPTLGGKTVVRILAQDPRKRYDAKLTEQVGTTQAGTAGLVSTLSDPNPLDIRIEEELAKPEELQDQKLLKELLRREKMRDMREGRVAKIMGVHSGVFVLEGKFDRPRLEHFIQTHLPPRFTFRAEHMPV